MLDKSANGNGLGSLNHSAKLLNGNGQLKHVVPPLTPHDSGRASPANPLAGRRTSTVVSNLIKSGIVFACSALHHDYSSVLMMLDAIGRGEGASLQPSMALSLAPFFCFQPLGIAAEAAVKRVWRTQRARFKGRWLTTFERVIGFTWTWLWLGWTAQFFVEGMARLGVWRVFPGYEYFTVLGGVWLV